MSGGLHLSVRVPWHDAGWSGSVCRDPLGNASCVLPKNIGEHRDDEYEVGQAGQQLELANPNRVPCVSERGSFMSPHSYELTKEHPYRFNPALKGRLQPTAVTVPAYGMHATPYFWLHRHNIPEVLRTIDVRGDVHQVDVQHTHLRAIGIDVEGWAALARKVIGAPPASFTVPTKKAAKKAAPGAKRGSL